MYKVSDNYKQQITASDRYMTYSGKITLSDKTEIPIAPSSIVGGTLYVDSKAVNHNEFSVGGCYSSELGLGYFSDSADNISFMNAEIEISANLELPDGSLEAVPLGIFKVDDVSKEKNATYLKALDRMILLDKPYPYSKVSDKTPFDLVSQACSECGVALENSSFSDFANSNLSLSTEENQISTYRDLIGMVCEILGAFSIINRSGKLELRKFASTPVCEYTNFFTSTPRLSDSEITIGRVVYNTISSGGGENSVVIPNNSFLETMTEDEKKAVLDNIYSQLSDVSFYSGEISTFGDPALDQGDTVSIRGKNVILMGYTWRFRGIASISSYGDNSTSEVEYDSVKKLAQTVSDNYKSLRFRMDDKYASLEASVDGFKAEVSRVESTANEALESVNNLEVGGTNLIRRSAELQGTSSNAWQWGGTGATYRPIEKVDGENYYKCTIERSGLTANGHTQFVYWHRSATGPTIAVGETYTVSVWYYCDSSVEFDQAISVVFYEDDSSGAHLRNTATKVQAANIVKDKWTRIVHTHTVTSENAYFPKIVFNLERNGKVSFCKPQLEKGNKATDWTPAPEDNLKNLTGRNLILGTSEIKTVGEIDKQTTLWYTLSPLITDDPKAFLLSLKDGGALCLSYDIDAPEVSKYSTSTATTRIGVYYTFTIKNISTGATASWYGHHTGPNYFTEAHTFNPQNNYNSMVSVTESVDAPGSYVGHYACYCVPSNGGTLKNFYDNPDNYTVTVNTVNCDFWCKTSGATISNVKLEVGNVPTEWSAAPEDLEQRVTKAEATLEVQAGKIEAKVDVGGVISAINLEKGTATINANKINFNGVVTANETFKILEDGSMEATGGTIGGWNIEEQRLYGESEKQPDTGAYYRVSLARPYTYDPRHYVFLVEQIGEGVALLSAITAGGQAMFSSLNVTGNTSLYGDVYSTGNLTAKNFQRGTLEVVVSSATVYVVKEIPLSFTPTETTQCVLTLRTTGSPQPRYLNCWVNYFKPNDTATPLLQACLTAGGSSATTVPAGTYYIDYIAANV